jgi:2-iminobutanoate/2-iminopropanoate deaminase
MAIRAGAAFIERSAPHATSPEPLATMRRFAFLAALLCAGACARATHPLVEFKPGPQPGPFSPAVRVDHLLFLAGKVGTDSDGRLVSGGIRAETRQVMENIRAELQRNGTSMDRVVKCTAFLADMGEWGTMNEVYATFFPGPKPARSALGANGLALNARVEIECIAVVD